MKQRSRSSVQEQKTRQDGRIAESWKLVGKRKAFKLCKCKTAQDKHMKDQNRSLFTKENEVKSRSNEHFNEVLNKPKQHISSKIFTEHPTMNENRSAFKELKIRKSPGYDNFTNELIRTDVDTYLCF